MFAAQNSTKGSLSSNQPTEIHPLGYGILNRELIIVETGSLPDLLASKNLGNLYGISILEIFPELQSIQAKLRALANSSIAEKASREPLVFSLESRKNSYLFRFESLPTLQSIVLMLADVGEFARIELKYQETQEQLKTVQTQLKQQVNYYQNIEARLLESSTNLLQTQDDFSDRVARLEALHKISVALSSTRETNALLQLIVEQAASLLNADSCSVALLEPETGDLIFLAAVDEIVGKRIPKGQGIMFRVLRNGGAQIIHDVPRDPDHYPQTGEESNLRPRSMVAVPLQLAGNNNIGVLAAVNRKETWFSDEDRDLLVTMASYAAIALENTHLIEKVQEQARGLEKKVEERTAELNVLYQRQAALAEIELSINQQHELNKVIEKIVAETRRLLTLNGEAVLILWDKKSQTFTSGASTSDVYSIEKIISRLRQTGGTSLWIVNNQQAIIEKDIDHPVLVEPNSMLKEIGLKAYAGMPLIAEGETLGVLYALDRESHDFSREDLDFLTALANRAANSIVKVRLYEAERTQRAEAEARAHDLRVRERHLAMLNDITRTAIEQQDLQTMLETIADRLISLFRASHCYITFWDEERFLTTPVATDGPTKSSYEKVQVPAEEITVTESVLKLGTALFIDDFPSSIYFQTKIERFFPGAKSLIALPLIVDQQPLGAAILGFNEYCQLTEQEVTLGEQVARQVALTITKTRAIETARQAAQEAETLREAGAIVAETLLQTEAIERILFQLARVIPYDSASVQLIRDNYLEIVGGRGWLEEEMINGLRFPIPGDNPNSIVVQEGRIFILGDARKSFTPFREQPHNHIRSWLGVPLIFRGKVIGMLALDSVKLNYFTQRHAELAMAFADQVAVAIENTRLFETTQRNEFEAKTARDILHRLNSVPDLIEAFPLVTEGLRALTNCTRISLALFSEDKTYFTMVALDQPDTILSKGTTMSVLSTSATQDVLTGQIHFTPDLSKEKDTPAENLLYKLGHRSRVNIPLQTPDGIIGTLNLTWKTTNGYLLDQIPILSQIADAIALAVQKARLYEVQSYRAKKLDELRAAIAVISSELKITKLYNTILERAVSLIEATGGEFGVYVEEKGLVEISACYQMDMDYVGAIIKPGRGIIGHVVKTRAPIVISDYRQWDGHFNKFDQGPWVAAIAAPVALGEKLLAIIALVDNRADHQFSPSDLQLLTLFADQVAITLENARLFQEVQTLATLDELTKINNRRRLFELGQIEFEKARRHHLPLSAVMIDIDHFKKVNDTYGHAAGDQVMRIIAKRCQFEIRVSDIFGRYGGEEFTILLPHTSPRDASNLAERLRASIAQDPFITERGEIPITISLGVATLTEDISDLASLIDRADTALLEAKNSGRNRSIVYKPQR